jgi:hypothetical protein
MVLKKTAKKLAALYEDLRSKGRSRINAGHVEHILDKIGHKERKVLDALTQATDEAERDKLTRKLAVIEQQRKRGEELLDLVRDDRG